MLLKTYFVSEFRSNTCEVVESSDGNLYHSKEVGHLAKLHPITARPPSKNDYTCTCHSLVMDTDGFLKLTFVVSTETIESKSPELPVTAIAQSKETFWRKPVQLPTLLAELLHDSSLRFNTAKILLKHVCPDLLACWPAEESIDDLNCNYVFFFKGKQNTDKPKQDWLKTYFELSQEYYTNKSMVLPLTNHLSLAYDSFGKLQDILKDDESHSVVLKGNVRMNLLLKDLKKETKEFSFLSYAPADEQDAQTEISVQDKILASKVRSALRRNMHCTENEISPKQDSTEPIYASSNTDIVQPWFIRLEFYLEIPADKFEIWFPHEEAYETALEMLNSPDVKSRLKENGKFKILEHRKSKNLLEANQASKIFWSDVSSFGSSALDSESLTPVLKCDMSFRLVCDYVPFQEEQGLFSEQYIRKALNWALEGIDFVLMIKQEPKYPLPQEVKLPVLKTSFERKFKEFLMIPGTKYRMFDGYRTPLIILRTKDAKDYRMNFLPCHNHFRLGELQPEFKYFEGTKEFDCYCFTSVGRTGESNVPTAACVKFKSLIETCSKSLRLSTVPLPNEDYSRVQFYFSFSDKSGTNSNKSLVMVMAPVQGKLDTRGVSVDKPLRQEIEQEIFGHNLNTSTDYWEFQEIQGTLSFKIYSQRTSSQIHNAVIQIVKSLEEYFSSKCNKKPQIQFPGATMLSHISFIPEEPELREFISTKGPGSEADPLREGMLLKEGEQRPPASLNPQNPGTPIPSGDLPAEVSNSRLPSNNGGLEEDDSLIGRRDDSGLNRSKDWIHNNNRSDAVLHSHNLLQNNKESLLKPFDRQRQLTEAIRCGKYPNCNDRQCPQFHLLRCGHKFCREGLRNHVRLLLDEHNLVTPLLCPYVACDSDSPHKHNCDKELLLSELMLLETDRAVWEKTHTHNLEEFLRQNRQSFEECSSGDCHNILRKSDGLQVCEYCNQAGEAGVVTGWFKITANLSASYYGRA